MKNFSKHNLDQHHLRVQQDFSYRLLMATIGLMKYIVFYFNQNTIFRECRKMININPRINWIWITLVTFQSRTFMKCNVCLTFSSSLLLFSNLKIKSNKRQSSSNMRQSCGPDTDVGPSEYKNCLIYFK